MPTMPKPITKQIPDNEIIQCDYGAEKGNGENCENPAIAGTESDAPKRDVNGDLLRTMIFYCVNHAEDGKHDAEEAFHHAYMPEEIARQKFIEDRDRLDRANAALMEAHNALAAAQSEVANATIAAAASSAFYRTFR